ncbi:bifunctional 3-phenylpropionate/cinnamic acid dioxygenase ferredoxin subunit [Mycobacterium vicinigordonae]|uniref:Bifunctional 3-phenylpropionate/cinnamic acid dioxygenase ferredoxin subunit n=1 Tax=Mycobacterium vicinigordonae TaxID=1719132 RepID=A0A7D6IQ68_9MYCO|nr:bifunctional 3-phenylpropionate/cinnamic acid dioxygenase ferredoxin subunit [Mycobacterium vicinigordonae]QLL06239.1 bifunctional 3-phenylpropionate/cinnamic acid dioxygenase ferredoxin subunit [Mycobacterium vicinigordonae]
MSSENKEWLNVCPLDDLPEGEAIRVDSDPPIAVFNVDGTILAIDDTCTHQEASLSEGWVEGYDVECPLHASCFNLRTGQPDQPPATEPVRVHRVTVNNGLIQVEVARSVNSIKSFGA